MQALSADGQQGQQAAQAKPGSGTFSWLDAFQARQEALKAQAAGEAALHRQMPVCTPPDLCTAGARGGELDGIEGPLLSIVVHMMP